MTKDTQSRWDEFERRCVPSSIGPMPRKTLRLAFCAGMLALRDAYIEEAMQPRETLDAAVDAMNADLDAFAESVLADAKEVFHV